MKIGKKILIFALMLCLGLGAFAACAPDSEQGEESKTEYTVTYNADGGMLTGETSVKVEKGNSVTLPVATKTGCTLDGWKDGETNVGAAGATYTPTADVTLTASWTVDPTAQYAAENLERAISYAKLIHDNYWDSTTCKSSLTPGGGVPFLWPYSEQAGMLNGILAAMDESHPDRAFFEQYLRETIEGFRYYRVDSATPSKDGYWENPNHVMARFGESSGAANEYAIYPPGRGINKDTGNTGFDGVYFDDNIWVAKEMYEAYRNLGDVKYLNESISIVNWILGEGYGEVIEGNGASAKTYGGIYWKWSSKFLHPGIDDDGQNASMNACSSAPTAMMLFKLADEMENPVHEGKYDALIENYRAKGYKIYSFIYAKLLDEANMVIYDKIFVNKQNDKLVFGILDQQELPYNTGTFMTAGAEVYKWLKEEGKSAADVILERNKKIAAGADRKFANTLAVPEQFAYNKNSWFTSFLITGYMDILPEDENCETYIEHMRSSLDYGWKNNRNDDGYVCPAWVEGWSVYNDNGVNSENNPLQILLQSANAHCYAMLAEHYQG